MPNAPTHSERASGADPFLVVGLGASAGGLEALEAFFSGLPDAAGLAFVVVVHLAPDEESQLADVLQRSLPLPVTQVSERARVQAGHVYVVPPGKNLSVADGELVLSPIEEDRVQRRPVDHFFRTLGDAWGAHAVGVVLSGTGQNGTVGVQRIREAGGFVAVQAPEDARFDEMPRSAIASGVADVVADAGEIAAEVVAYARRLRREQLPETPEALAENGVRALRRVLTLLRARTRHDFSHYKRSTVLRRLDRRLHVTGAENLTAYADRLRTSSGEAEALLDDLLISVTNFFRDPEAFEGLAAEIPALFEGKTGHDEVRAWAAGCATGEEAYSVAMLLLEHADTLSDPPRVQVFATDLSANAVAAAREGAYPESIEADVSERRLERFFSHTGGQYRVREVLREAVLFAQHSLLKDPPFSRLDLVTCRNLLIYLQRDAQLEVLGLVHYALRPDGLLMLGTSETTEGTHDLFGAIGKETRLFRRRDVQAPLPRIPLISPGAPAASRAPEASAPEASALPLADEYADLHRSLRERAASPSVLVNADGDIVDVSPEASPFLHVASGPPARSLGKLLRPELRTGTQAALFQARRESRPASSAWTRVEMEGEPRLVRAVARPSAGGGLVHIVFETQAPEAGAGSEASGDGGVADALETELRQTREQLQVTIEEFETSREELRAQNEELQSINEELRSTAEELETAKEEAQSMSEELRTVNDELKAKVDETTRAKADVENLIVSTEIATLFLDRDLRIKRFTPHVRELFHVLASDLGRPLADLAQRFSGAHLIEDAEAVVDRLEVKEREVRGENGRWYLLHVRPYRTAEGQIGGVVVTFVDITDRKEQEEALRAGADRFRALVDASAQIVWTTDARGLVVEDSPSWRAVTGQSLEAWLGEGWADAAHPDDRESLLATWRGAVSSGELMDARFRLRHGASGAWRWTHVRAVPMLDEAGDVGGFVGMNEDVHEAQLTKDALIANATRADFRTTLADALRTLDDPVEVQAAAARVLGEHLGASRVHYAEISADEEHAVVVQDYASGVPDGTGRYSLDDFATLTDANQEGLSFFSDDLADDSRLDDDERDRLTALPVRGIATVPLMRESRLSALLAVHFAEPHAWDPTEVSLVEETAERTWDAVARARAEVTLRRSEERYRLLVEGVTEYAMLVLDSEGRITSWNAGAERIFLFGEADAVGEPGAIVFTPEDRAAGVPESEMRTAERTGRAVNNRYHVRADGSRFWASGVVTSLRLENGTLRGFSKILRDNTEAKLAEDALRESEERFRQAVAVADLGTWDYDVASGLTTLDARARAIFGLKDERLPSETVMDLVHPDDREAFKAAQEATIAPESPNTFSHTHRIELPDGRVRWIRGQAEVFFEGNGAGRRPLRALGVVLDVTEQKEVEEAIRRLNATLESRVAERTRQVRHLSARLAAAEQEERRRIAHLLHDDLQQRLTGLRLVFDLYRDAQSPQEAEELGSKAQAILEQATGLTRSLAIELSPPVLLSTQLVEVLEWLAALMRERHQMEVVIETDGDCEILDLNVRTLLYETLREVLFNVVKHAGTKQATLRVRCGAEKITVTVQDGGSGFDASALNARGEGSQGFGLHGVRQRLEMIGGDFAVDSAPGQGTRVALTVPR